MKTKALVSSILTIALCLSLIAGSTFALFTFSDSVNVSINSGKVEMNANLANLKLFSAEANANGTEFDELGHRYNLVPVKVDGVFTNGGTAVISENLIEIERITPGDKFTFQLTGANTSNVAIQYRYIIECVSGHALMKGFETTVEGKEYEALATYVSPWKSLAAGNNITPVDIAMLLPVCAGNEYQNKDAQIRVTIEAIQGNADVPTTTTPDVTYINSPKTAADLVSMLNSKEPLYIYLDEDFNETVKITADIANKTIDAQRHNATLEFFGKLTNVVVTNVVDNNDNVPAIKLNGSTTGDITISNSDLNDDLNTQPFGAIAGGGGNTNLDVTVNKCNFKGGLRDDGSNLSTYGFYIQNVRNLTITECTFENFGDWAIIVNGDVAGDIVISGCKFTNCAAVVKGGVVGDPDTWRDGTGACNFTFVNNTMVNCYGKDSTSGAVNYIADVDPVCGVITFTGNTINGIPATIDDMSGMKKDKKTEVGIFPAK